MSLDQRILRYLGHDGQFHYYTGTNNVGEPQFTTDKAAAYVFPSSQHATRIGWVCDSFDYEVESLAPHLA